MRCEIKRRQHRLILLLIALIVAFVRLLSRRLQSLDVDETLFRVETKTTPFSSTQSRPFSTAIPTSSDGFKPIGGDDDFRLSDVDFRLELAYSTFTPRLPQFVDDLDRLIFSNDPVNLRYLRAPPSRELTGRVKVVRDAIIRVRHHECSWLTTEDEFQTISPQHLADTGPRERENNDSSIGFAFQCPLLVPDGHTFQHFVDGVLPKLVQLLGVIGDLSSAVQYILFRPRDHVIYEILETLRISRDQLMLVPPPLDNLEKTHDNDVIRSTRLIDACVTPAVHPALWRRARRLLVDTTHQSREERRFRAKYQDNLERRLLEDQSIVGGTSTSTSDNELLTISPTTIRHNVSFLPSNDPNESSMTLSDMTDSQDGVNPLGSVVLLSRRWSRNRGRRLLNEREVFDELVAHFGPNRVVVYPDNHITRPDTRGRRSRRVGLSAARQVFAAAHTVIGVHGGAFYNIVMAPVNCTVIEVIPSVAYYGNASRVPSGLAHTIVWRMAEALGHNYWRLYAPTTSAYADVTLPVERLRKVLKRL